MVRMFFAKFACFDVKNFCLATPMDRSEFVKIKIGDIPQEFVLKYNLIPFAHNGWVYFEIICGCYGLPQSGRLATDLFCKHLNKAGYFEAVTTPGLWKHTWRPIQFCLIPFVQNGWVYFEIIRGCYGLPHNVLGGLLLDGAHVFCQHI